MMNNLVAARWKSSIHTLIGGALIFVGVWVANGNLVSIGGVISVLGCLCILLEIYDVGSELAERQALRQKQYFPAKRQSLSIMNGKYKKKSNDSQLPRPKGRSLQELG